MKKGEKEEINITGATIGKQRATGQQGQHPNPQEIARSVVHTKLWVTVNERNLRIGESHPRAVLTDHDVELMLELREEGFSYRWLAVKFEVSLRQAYRVCTGKQRSQIPTSRRRVLVRG